jgi:hypothetical protein
MDVSRSRLTPVNRPVRRAGCSRLTRRFVTDHGDPSRSCPVKQAVRSGHISHLGVFGRQTEAHKSSTAKLNALELPVGIIFAASCSNALLRAGFEDIGESNPKKRYKNRATLVSTIGTAFSNAKLKTARAA